MKNITQQFYDQLADDYHLIYADWQQSIKKQSLIIDKLIRSLGYRRSARILDCSCGIGTQAIGLAHLGYKVLGTDLSPKAIARARKESKKFGVKIRFQVADFRKLKQKIKDTFDIAITCDNSLPHLLTDTDLSIAVRNIYQILKPNGLLLASIRDYDNLLRNKPTFIDPNIFGKTGNHWFSFQVWDWHKSKSIYTLNHFIIKKHRGCWSTSFGSVKYRAIKRSEFAKVLQRVGFSNITWHMPKETGYYQPIVTAKKEFEFLV